MPVKAYLSIRGSDAPWIENSYRCPVCDYEWLDFDDHPCEAFCFECGEEGIAPYRSRPFV